MADKKYVKVTTPKGIAVFPRLNKPEVKVGDKEVKPRYTCAVSLEKADPKVAEFLKKLDGLVEEAVAAYRAKNPKKKVNVCLPYRASRTKNGDEYEESETHVTISAKTSAFTKDGKPRKVPLFDAHGQPLKGRPNIGGGSTVRFSATVQAYDMSAKQGSVDVGITLYLDAVKIIDLVEFGGGNAKSHGFDEDDGGSFSADSVDESMESDEAGDEPQQGADEAPASDGKGAQDF